MTSTPLAPTIPADDPLVALRRRHQALLARLVKEAPSPEERGAFMAELVASGRSVSGERARDALQNMLFYWAADATTRGELPKTAPPPRLDDFLSLEATPASESAVSENPAGEDAAAPLEASGAAPDEAAEPAPPSDTLETAPRQHPSSSGGGTTGLEGLLGSVLSAPHDSPRAPTSGLSNILGGLVGSVVQGGTILAQATERLIRPSQRENTRGENPVVEPAHSPEPAGSASSSQPPSIPAPESVPISEVETIARARAVLRFSAYARQWQRAEPGKQVDFLLKGSALAEASLYVDEDPGIRAHVEASEAARDEAERFEKQRIQFELTKNRRRSAVLAVIALAAVALAVLSFVQSQRLQEALRANEKLLQETRTALNAKDAALKATEAAIEAQDKAERQKSAALEDLSKAVSPGRGDLPDKIERLEQRQATLTSDRNDIVTSRLPRPSDKPPVPVPPTPAQACTGYLWFGSTAESRIAGGRDPATLKPGDKVEINMQADIRLRERAPLPGYVMSQQVGLVPAGSAVTVSETLPPYQRPSGAQIWARVSASRQFCTSVFLQYAGKTDRLDEIKTRLQGIGVQTPPAEQLETAANKAEVRYYWPEDAPVARQVAEALAGFARDGKPLRLTPLVDFPPKAKAKPTTIEVWLDLD